MRIDRSKWKMTDADFGPLLPFVQDENVTDINYNGSAVWIDDLTKGRYRADIRLSNSFVETFSARVADEVSETFNQYNPLLEAETDTLRISIIHEEYANTGRSISIRKTPVIRRLNKRKMIDEDYCSAEFLDFVEQCVAAKMNILMCGAPGTGKTEFLKYLTSYIPADDRVITIEDNLEIHYSEINPGKDCVELKVDNQQFSYITAIKACLRQNPQWILLSEARSTEVKHLLESMSTGTHCLTTIHTDDVRKVPDRIKNMVQDSVIAARIENDVYSFLDAAILIKKGMRNGKIYRYIEQMGFFSREAGDVNQFVMVVDDGKFVCKELPSQILYKFAQAGISDPFARPEANAAKSADETFESVPGEVVDQDAPKETNAESNNSDVAQGEQTVSDKTESNEGDEVDTAAENVSDENASSNMEEISSPSEEETSEFYTGNVLEFSYDEHVKDDIARARRARNRQ